MHGSGHSSSVTREARRAGHIWTLESSNRDELHPVRIPAAAARGIMKVATLEDSLRAADRKSRGRTGPGDPLGAFLGAAKKLSSQKMSTSGCDVGGSRRSLKKGPSFFSRRNIGRSASKSWMKARSSSREDSSKKGRGAGVQFGPLHFREYEILAVDNPGISQSGAGIGIGWNYTDSPSSTVNEFELSRGPGRRLMEIKMPREAREAKLLENGVTEDELQAVTRSICTAKKKRVETLKNMKLEKRHETWENLYRKAKIILRIKKKDRKAVDKLWDQANTQSPALLAY